MTEFEAARGKQLTTPGEAKEPDATWSIREPRPIHLPASYDRRANFIGYPTLRPAICRRLIGPSRCSDVPLHQDYRGIRD